MKAFYLFILVCGISLQSFAFKMSDLDKAVASPSGVRNMKPVLNGVLYRAGGPGGQQPMKSASLQGLCEVGFTDAAYLYPDGFSGPSTQNCSRGSINYNRHGFKGADGARSALNQIHKLIKHGGKMLVHCWNGLHASGEVAAYALIQFCDMSPSAAKAYWERNSNGYKIQRVLNFKKISGLEISDSDKARICPN